jgi:hypothetical protein
MAVTPEQVSNLYGQVGGRVTGEGQTYLDSVYSQFQSGSMTAQQASDAFNNVLRQANAGYTGLEGSSVGFDSSGVPDAASAKTILQSGLAQYGLESVYDALWTKYVRGEVDAAMDPDAFIYSLKEEPAYKQRFAANEIRKAKGLSELLPSTYLAMEQQYKNTMSLNGLSQSYYSDQTKLEKLIGGDVAINELNNRLRDAYRVVKDAPADVTEKLKTMYGLTDGDILSYFLDPEQARKDMTSADYKIQAQAALTAAKAERQAGLQLGTPFAEKVARAGLTDTQTTNAFESIAGMRELGRAAQTEAGLSQEQVAGSALGLDTEAKKRLDELKRQKVASLSGGGSFSQRQVSGSIKSSIGEA